MSAGLFMLKQLGGADMFDFQAEYCAVRVLDGRVGTPSSRAVWDH